jgi:cellulose synthase/poly-beta-1,6-N-acetylglucosamine synthase-like glycosyltransferase
MHRAAQALIDAAPGLAAPPMPPPGRKTRFRKPLVDLTPTTPDQFPSVVGTAEASALRAALKETRLDLLQLRRNVAALALRQAGTDPNDLEDAARSAAFDDAQPRVSVVTALYNHAEHITEALDSAAASTLSGLEIVITDDGSTDGSPAVVRNWLERSPQVAARLLRHRVNRGLGSARNTALGFARGEFVLFLDADNVLYPPAIEKLVTALDEDREAVLSYGILEMFGAQGAVGLRSWLDWRPDRFRKGNFVDALALVRRDWLVETGGFVTDARLHGWEDYDLWCRVTDAGHHGAFVPEIVARYRSAPHSMLSLTDLSTRQAVGLLAERHPAIFGDVELPL